MTSNPFAPLYAACNTGDGQAKYDALAEFPRMLDLELTSACNFRCLQCPVGNLSMTRPAQFMDAAVFESIVKQCALHGTALRLIGWGEPLLHPEVVRFVALARANGLLVHINTNASRITPELARALCQAGLSSIKFSFQGVDRQSYLEMRRTDFFEGMIGAISDMVKARAAEGGPLPHISASTSITYETDEQVAEFRERLGGLVDYLSIGHTTFDFMDMGAVRLKPAEREMLERLASLQTVEKRHPDPCPEVFDKLSIHADGQAVVCCNDYNALTNLGNVEDTPIAEMWRHPQIEEYRKRLAAKEYGGPLCSVCYDYAGLTKGAVAHDA